MMFGQANRLSSFLAFSNWKSRPSSVRSPVTIIASGLDRLTSSTTASKTLWTNRLPMCMSDSWTICKPKYIRTWHYLTMCAQSNINALACPYTNRFAKAQDKGGEAEKEAGQEGNADS